MISAVFNVLRTAFRPCHAYKLHFYAKTITTIRLSQVSYLRHDNNDGDDDGDDDDDDDDDDDKRNTTGVIPSAVDVNYLLVQF